MICFVTFVTAFSSYIALSLPENKLVMEQLHAHEVLHMMEGNSYSEATLKEAIIKQFGKDQHFYACSADDMNIDELIEFLKRKGKFMPYEDGFTVDVSKVCDHK